MSTTPPPPWYAHLLSALDAGESLDVGELCAQFAKIRGRPVLLHPHRLPPDTLSGLWIEAEHADIVVYDDTVGALEQYRSVAHTLGHIASATGQDILPLLLAPLAPAAAAQPAARGPSTSLPRAAHQAHGDGPRHRPRVRPRSA